MWAFAKAVGMGTLTGALLPIMFWLVVGLGSRPSSESLRDFAALSGYSIVVAFIPVFAASLIIGLPIAAVLRRLDAESQEAYVVIGCFAGFAVTIVTLIVMSAKA